MKNENNKYILKLEVTDTFGGRSNYSWVKRQETTEYKALTRRQIVQRAKRFANITGMRCRVEDFGDMIAIWPAGICQVCFVNFDY